MRTILEGEKKMKKQESKITLNQKKTIKIAKMGVLAAISIILVYFIRFPIFPAVPFLEYDPADIPILIGGFAFGPLAGILLTIVVSVLQGITVSAASGIYGIIMHIIATSTLVGIASIIYKRKKNKKSAVVGLAVGSVSMTCVMFFANLLITPKFMMVPVEAVLSLMPFILLFNLVKAGLNSLITFIIYKKISGILHK